MAPVLRHTCASKAFKNVSRGASLDTTAGSSSVRSGRSGLEGTLIFADWDDTLFPSTELFDRWDLELHGPVELNEERRQLLSMWQRALCRFLRAIGELSEHCAIITNAESRWVEHCLQRFAPEVLDLISQTCSVLHAKEVLDGLRASKKLCGEVPLPARYVDVYRSEEPYVMHVEMSAAKYQAMRSELKKAFGRHQKGLNIINFGDMEYEHEAVLELGVRISEQEPQIKSFLLPEVPRRLKP